jgi:transcriptional antiterminator NusG
VTGFVGPGSKPVPLSPEEMVKLGFGVPEGTVLHEKKVLIDLCSRRYRHRHQRTVERHGRQDRGHQRHKKTVSMMVEMFGRETKVELGFTEVKKM